jgi:hypothetical protein
MGGNLPDGGRILMLLHEPSQIIENLFLPRG